MYRKGISAVVATILIVLLAVAAVAIVWAVLRPALVKTAGGVGVNCIEVDLNADSCSKSNVTANVKATLNSGTISKVRVLFYDAAGNTLGSVDQTTDIPRELETKTWVITPPTGITITNIAAANVAGIIKTAGGDDKACTPTSAKVTCA